MTASADPERARRAAYRSRFALLYVVGFAGPQLIHDAAHDTRHSLNFPCH